MGIFCYVIALRCNRMILLTLTAPRHETVSRPSTPPASPAVRRLSSYPKQLSVPSWHSSTSPSAHQFSASAALPRDHSHWPCIVDESYLGYHFHLYWLTRLPTWSSRPRCQQSKLQGPHSRQRLRRRTGKYCVLWIRFNSEADELEDVACDGHGCDGIQHVELLF